MTISECNLLEQRHLLRHRRVVKSCQMRTTSHFDLRRRHSGGDGQITGPGALEGKKPPRRLRQSIRDNNQKAKQATLPRLALKPSARLLAGRPGSARERQGVWCACRRRDEQNGRFTRRGVGEARADHPRKLRHAAIGRLG